MRAYFYWKSSSKSLTFGFAFRRHSKALFFDPRDRRFRTFLTLVLSILLHCLVLWLLFHFIELSKGGVAGPRSQTLNVVLGDTPQKATPASAPPTPAPPTPAPEPQPVEQQPRPRRDVIASRRPSPFHVPSQTQQAPLPPLPPLPQSNQPAQPDMSDMLNAKRDARAAAEAHERQLQANGGSEESDDERAKRIITSNLAHARGKEYEEGGGGIFEIKEQGLHDATLIFHGWNHDMRRNMSQEVFVKQGSEPNIQMAIVDEVIRIIRLQYNGDFQWDSQRLGKAVTRSARKEDEAALKDFLFQEFNFNENLELNRGPPPEAPPPRRGRL